jgi:ElaB/YqjD/DUF883 family membrane-anchored ribosome-binding protein
MNSLSSEHTSRSTHARGSAAPAAPAEPPLPPESAQPVGVGETMNQLSRDVMNMKDTLAKLVSQVGDRGVKAVQGAGQSVASQVGSAASGMADTGSNLVSAATGHAKSFASELEDMARRNPLGTIAGALLIGAFFGVMSRGRG